MIDRITRAFWLSAICIWLSSGLIAAPPLTITNSGYWLTIVDSAGVPSLVRVQSIIDLRSVDAPAPEPKPNPETPEPPAVDYDLDVVRASKAAAELIADPNGSQAIKAVYDHVVGAFDDGLLDASSVWPALKTATDNALTITSGSINWAPFRASMSTMITERKQRGGLQSKDEIAKMLLSIAQGASMAADGKPALPESQIFEIAIKTNEAIDGQ